MKVGGHFKTLFGGRGKEVATHSEVKEGPDQEIVKTAGLLFQELGERLFATPEFTEKLFETWWKYSHNSWHPDFDFIDLSFERNGADYKIWKPSAYSIHIQRLPKEISGSNGESLSIYYSYRGDDGSFYCGGYSSNEDPEMAELKAREFMDGLEKPAK
ncbi:MAG: hypothetical protein A2W22_00110 [Candidatus Levybacteria bacterium RBG_16_35_11]|nr:MAG: hypothetical protein A2W22_00110 [Candidatus Levybacteria bacterium RBG_16_35_11]